MRRTKGADDYQQSRANATWSDRSTFEAEGLLSSSMHRSSCSDLPSSSALSSTCTSPLKRSRSPLTSLIGASSSGLLILEGRANASLRSARTRPRTNAFDDVCFSSSAKEKCDLVGKSQIKALLEKLRTDDFVGTVDPEFHSPYLKNPDHMKSPTTTKVPKTVIPRCSSGDSLSEESTFSNDSRRTSGSFNAVHLRLPGPPPFKN